MSRTGYLESFNVSNGWLVSSCRGGRTRVMKVGQYMREGYIEVVVDGAALLQFVAGGRRRVLIAGGYQ